MSIARFSDISLKGYDGGQNCVSSFRKVASNASVQGVWCDLSSAPGNPKPNYYVGAELAFTTLDGSLGLYHGGNVSPSDKSLHKFLIGSQSAGAAPATFMLCDYLGFYPLVDMDSTDPQVTTNAVTLPRYATGAGVEMILVATNPYAGGAQFYVDYTSADGLPRQSFLETSNSTTFIGTVVHAAPPTTIGGKLFIRRPRDCRGVRSVQGITFLAPNGGLAALVLVRPIASMMLNEIGAYAEHIFAEDRKTIPRVYDGAYLNLFCMPNGSVAAAPINGIITTIWN